MSETSLEVTCIEVRMCESNVLVFLVVLCPFVLLMCLFASKVDPRLFVCDQINYVAGSCHGRTGSKCRVMLA